MQTKEKILLYSATFWNFSDGMFGPLLAVFTQRIGGNILDVSWAWATYLVVTGLCVIVVGKLSDRYNKTVLLVLGYSLTTVFTFCYLLVDDTLSLLLVQAGLGLALSFSNPTWTALYDKYSDITKKGFAWGLVDEIGRAHV